MINATAMSSYFGGRPVGMKLTAQNTVFASSAIGNGNLVLPISFAGVNNGLTRFGSAFDEVRTLSCVVRINPISSVNGYTSFFWSEKQLSTPTTTSVAQRITRDITNSSGAGTGYVMRWKSDGFQDLSWDPLSAPVAAAYFYIFTDASYGTPAAVNSLFNVQIELEVQFRGVSNQ
jgi:hypothetical protein